jgi:L-serine---[L-seryl-carrier protein] ligase
VDISALVFGKAANARRVFFPWQHRFTSPMSLEDSATSLGQAFSLQAARWPYDLAVSDSADSITYDHLDAWSGAVAANIHQNFGTSPGIILQIARFDCTGVAGLISAAKTRHALLTVDAETPLPVVGKLVNAQNPILCLHGRETRRHAEALNRDTGLALLDLDEFRRCLSLRPFVAAAQRQDLSALMRTSGSTGATKLVAVTHASDLERACKGSKLNLVRRGAHYAAASSIETTMGRWAALRALMGGATLLPLDLLRESPRQAVERLLRSEITHFHTTPTALRLLAAGFEDRERFASLEFIHLGGERMTRHDLDLVRTIAPFDCIVHATYGSSETGTVGYATYTAGERRPDAPAELTILESVDVEIVDERGAPLPAGKSGRIRVTSNRVSAGYKGNTDADLASRHSRHSDGRPSVVLDDIGYRTPSGGLVLEKRIGHEVKVRGVRVDLIDLEEWLLAQPGVREAAVFPVEDKTGNIRIAAAVAGDIGALRMRMEEELPREMRPTHLLIRETLPRTIGLKTDRQALLAEIGSSPEDEEPSLRLDGLGATLIESWERVLGRPVPSRDARFDELGGDSIAALSLALHLESVIGRRVEAGFVWQNPSFSEQLSALEASPPANTEKDRLVVPLVASETSGNKTVFAVSGWMGNDVFRFFPVAQRLAPDWEMVGLLHPRFRPEEPEIHAVGAIAQRLVAAVRSVQPHGPYFLFGYSFGGLIAQELARLLELEGDRTGVVIVDTRPRAFVGARDRTHVLLKHWSNKYAVLGYLRYLRRRGVAVWRRGEKSRPALTDGKRSDPESERLNRLWQVRREEFNSYRPRRSSATVFLIKAEHGKSHLPDFGWSRVAPLAGIRTVPGNHSSLLDDTHADVFAESTVEALEILSKLTAESIDPDRVACPASSRQFSPGPRHGH